MTVFRGSLLVLLAACLHTVLSIPVTVYNGNLSSGSLSRSSTNVAILPASVANLSVIPIPEEFQIVPRITQPIKFRREACYLNTIHALKDIALGDFEGQMPPSSFSTKKFPQLIIQLNPTFLTTIQRKYVVWALFLAIQHMNEQDAFQPTVFSLKLGHEGLGRIEYGTPRPESRLLEQSANHTGISGQPTMDVDGIQGRPASTVSTEVSNRLLSIHYRYFGKPPPYIGKNGVFMTVVGALTQAAIPAADADVRYMVLSRVAGEHCTLSATPTRTTPPFLRFEDFIQSLANAADFYLANRIYTQLDMQLRIDGTTVASVILSYNREPNPPSRSIIERTRSVT